MAIKFPDKVKCSENGNTSEVRCPHCAAKVEMRLFKTTDHSILPTLLEKDGTTNFAVCPNCAAVFNVRQEYLDAKDAGNAVFATPDDFNAVERS